MQDFKGTICKTDAKHLKVVLQSKFKILDSIVGGRTPPLLPRLDADPSCQVEEGARAKQYTFPMTSDEESYTVC